MTMTDDDGATLMDATRTRTLRIRAREHEIDAGHDVISRALSAAAKTPATSAAKSWRPRWPPREHQHPEVPIQPADHETRAVAQPRARELRERADVGMDVAISPSMRITSKIKNPQMRSSRSSQAPRQ